MSISVKIFAEVTGYNVLKRIGKGGSSTVYLAEKNGKKYAIKIPTMEISATLTKDDIDKFLREAEMWKKLSRKYPEDIVYVENYGKNPIPWIAMEYCDYSLRTLLKNGPLSLETAIAVAIKIAEALDKIHHHGIVHMDIKPENILFKNNVPKISDFGIAITLLQVSATVSKYPGTPLYSAPEQIYPKKFGEVDWRTDIWQFGCLLYEMVEGKPPISKFLSPLELIAKITQGEPEPMQYAPKWLQEIILSCLRKRKEERPLDMGIIVESLRKHASIISTRPRVYETAESSVEGFMVSHEEPLSSIEAVLRQLKVATVGVLAKKLDLSKEDIETYLALSEHAVPSKRPSVYYSLEHIKNVKEKLLNMPRIEITDTEIKKLKIFREDLEDILKEVAVQSRKLGVWYGKKYWEKTINSILNILETKGWILANEIKGLEKEDIEAILEKNADRSLAVPNLWYRRGVIDYARSYLAKMKLAGEHINNVAKIIKIHPRDIQILLQDLGYNIVDGIIRRFISPSKVLDYLVKAIGIKKDVLARRIKMKNRHITKIDLSGLGIANIDLSFLNELNVEEIYLNYNRLESIDWSRLPLSIKLRVLSFIGNKIRNVDLSPISRCQLLEELLFGRNLIEKIDITSLYYCKNLRKLDLSCNKIKTIDLSPLSNCTKLEYLLLDSNNLSTIDLSPLSNCKNLKVLSISNNRIAELDLRPLAKCENLEELWLHSNVVNRIDISSLRYMKNLRIYADPDTRLVGAKLYQSNEFKKYIEYVIRY